VYNAGAFNVNVDAYSSLKSHNKRAPTLLAFRWVRRPRRQLKVGASTGYRGAGSGGERYPYSLSDFDKMQQESAMSPSPNDNDKIARKFFETLSAGDYGPLEKLFTPDAVWTVVPTSIPGSGDHKGAATIAKDFSEIRKMFEDGDPKLHVTNVIDGGQWVAVETHTKGRFKNGATYDSHYCWVMEIIDGKIRVLKEYMDGGYAASRI
jgi:uncharacterized protein